ncbi:hypothetical protein [Yoonia sp. I 8.24]|uniref:hypothetical protein n=1 Tax=Yoonia sp. I 8.24 TaxID=1537229 RepID=UPI001EDF2C4B|nr:hypothetical protein [Yoonia sp. I 8.24]MCG3267173.1 hypothetical protein [Yoonia sp. I 8.24]
MTVAVGKMIDASFDAASYMIDAGYRVSDGIWLDASAGQSMIDTTVLQASQRGIRFKMRLGLRLVGPVAALCSLILGSLVADENRSDTFCYKGRTTDTCLTGV